MLKVHGRSSNEKVVIKLNNKGQPIGDKKPRRELSNFLGTLVKDHVSLTHVNWHVVPEELKKRMLNYILVTSITKTYSFLIHIFPVK